MRKQLEQAIGVVGLNSVPVELTESYPGGRFRPFSVVEVNGKVTTADRLLPQPSWQFEQDRIFSALQIILSSQVRGLASS